MRVVQSFAILALLLVAGLAQARADEPAAEKQPAWVEPMRAVHARFKGTPGTLAQFGDSITVTMAYWAPLADEPKGLSKEAAAALARVKKHMRAECWREWKGGKYGSDGGMTIRWARENIDTWLAEHDPEAAVIMFGTNDLGQVPLDEYSKKTGEVVDRCLANGTVPILTTIPPRSGLAEKSKEFAEAVRKIAAEKKIPLIDYQAEILRRRPHDWDGAQAKFKSDATPDVYNVPTLVSGDGVHPSYPAAYRDYSEESLAKNGYALRNYLTLLEYANVIERVLKPK